MTAILVGSIPFDWSEAERIAASPKYRCEFEFWAVLKETQEEMEKPQK